MIIRGSRFFLLSGTFLSFKDFDVKVIFVSHVRKIANHLHHNKSVFHFFLYFVLQYVQNSMCCHIHLNVKGLYANYLSGDGVHFLKKHEPPLKNIKTVLGWYKSFNHKSLKEEKHKEFKVTHVKGRLN